MIEICWNHACGGKHDHRDSVIQVHAPQSTYNHCLQSDHWCCLQSALSKADVDIVEETDQTREMTTTVSQIILSCHNIMNDAELYWYYTSISVGVEPLGVMSPV